MEKRRIAVSLSFVLLRFFLLTGGLVAVILVVFYYGMLSLISLGWVLPAHTAEQQVFQFVEQQQDKEHFVSNEAPVLAHYVLFDANGDVLITANRNNNDRMINHYRNGEEDGQMYDRHTYPDGTTVLFTWRYVAEFSDPDLQRSLPPFEYLWYGVFASIIILCVLLTTRNLQRQLVSKLQLLSEVSKKVGQQELDFDVPETGIKEFNEAMGAMDDMRTALKDSLSAQWVADQRRRAEISTLAHDLKTPLTIIGGNADLLLEDELAPDHKKIVQIIASNTGRARLYVSSMLEAEAGATEPLTQTAISVLLDEAVSRVKEVAASTKVRLEVSNKLTGNTSAQVDRLCRAIGNILQNAVEHTPPGRTVRVEGKNTEENSWVIQVEDEGHGFSEKALNHATERFWRDDAARGNDGHNGLGLWFSNEVIEEHEGTLTLSNGKAGGTVLISMPRK